MCDGVRLGRKDQPAVSLDVEEVRATRETEPGDAATISMGYLTPLELKVKHRCEEFAEKEK
jgi:hypothetical protein